MLDKTVDMLVGGIILACYIGIITVVVGLVALIMIPALTLDLLMGRK